VCRESSLPLQSHAAATCKIGQSQTDRADIVVRGAAEQDIGGNNCFDPSRLDDEASVWDKFQTPRSEYAHNCGLSREGDEVVLDNSNSVEAAKEVQRYPTLTLLNFTRHPPTFDKRLLNGEELREVREALARAGLSSKLPCGTKVFVDPSEYKCAMLAITGRKLGQSFVIVSDELKHIVLAAVADLPRKDNVRVRDQQSLAYMHPERDELLNVKHTFLCEVRPVAVENCTNSSTQARRGTQNPRAKSSTDLQ